MILGVEHEKKVSSQFGEDGIMETILAVIGEGGKRFIEIGVGDGNQCNCINLKRNHGWSGVLIDCAYANDDVIKRFVNAENIQDVLREAGAAEHPDVLSLDIDGNDWYVMANLGPYVPRLLVCEFNAHFQHGECFSIPYDPNWKFTGTRFHGASQRAMHRLGNELGLSMVYATCVNAFMVANEYNGLFDNADDPEKLYHEPWRLPDDARMHLMVDPFTVERPKLNQASK